MEKRSTSREIRVQPNAEKLGLGAAEFSQGTSNTGQVAPVPVIFSKQDKGATGPSQLGTGDDTTTTGAPTQILIF
jgi:hypothetical protein